MLNFVCLSPYFPSNFSLFWVRLHEAGARVLGIGDLPYEQLSPELKEALTEYYWVEDMHKQVDLEKACQHFIDKYGAIDRLESQNEYWLEAEAQLRGKFKIQGPQDMGIHQIKSKAEMKQTYQQAGIPVAKGHKVTFYESALSFIQEVGYPVVVKPDVGVGAAHTYKLNGSQDFKEFWETKPDVTYFMEEFIQGDLYSFDGLVNQKGQIVFCASHHFNHGIMEIVNQDLDLAYYSLKEIPQDLYEAGEKVIEAFGIKERFFHFEFFRTPDQRLVALEVNVRPPGGLTTDMFNFANDIDIYKGYAELMIKGHFPFENRRHFHCAYAGRKRDRNYIYSHEELNERLGDAIVHFQTMSEVFYKVMGYCGYLIRYADFDELQNAIKDIQATHED